METKYLKYLGIAASIVLIAFGIGSTITGVNGRSTVRDNLALEQISGTPDMTPRLIAATAKKSGLKNVALPTCTAAGKAINTGARAKCFASYMRIHTLEATGGRTFSEMGRYLTASGKETSDTKAAAVNPKTGQPVPNGARDIWVTETALSTALNTGYFAENVALFAIIMGLALLLTGVGFLVLTLRWMSEPTTVPREADTSTPARPVRPAIS